MKDTTGVRSLLELEHVSVSFGGVRAVDDCTFRVESGQVSGLIGPNGAGKSSLVGLICGVTRPSTGRVWFAGRDTTGFKPYVMGRLGCIRTFQMSREFRRLTVLENVMAAAPARAEEGLARAIFRPRAVRRADSELAARALELLAEVGLSGQEDKLAGDLSGGQKRLLELGRALMAEPKLLILDEPFAGVSPFVMEMLYEHIRRVAASGASVLMIEHLLGAVETVCDDVTVMAGGRILTRGALKEVLAHEEVVSSYLGTPPESAANHK
jgi:ABC-type branched-subunit amino acid transport system ATPase component